METTKPTQPIEEQYKFPDRLKLDTPEKLAAADAAQKELAKKINSPFANATPEERERDQAARLVTEHTATAELLQIIVRAHEARKTLTLQQSRELNAARDALPVILTQLAEAHATTGRFDMAAEVEPDRKQKAWYLRVWRAVWRDDAHWCKCPKTNAGHTQTAVDKDIFSVKHGAVMSLLKCGGCRCLNVAPRPKEIEEGRAHRRQAAALAAGKTPDEARRILTDRKHTSRELLK